MLVKKMVCANIAPDPYEMVPIYVMYHLELAAAWMHPNGEDLSNIECDYCSIFVGLGLATLHEEQQTVPRLPPSTISLKDVSLKLRTAISRTSLKRWRLDPS
jgi:hypothetical protein